MLTIHFFSFRLKAAVADDALLMFPSRGNEPINADLGVSASGGLEIFSTAPDLLEEHNEFSDTKSLRGGRLRRVKAGASGIRFASVQGLKLRLLFRFLMIAVFLAFSFCIQKYSNPLRKGIQHRRLAGDQQENHDVHDAGPPPSPDYSELCFQLGTWLPPDPVQGHPRASPALVEDYFKSIEQHASEQPFAQASSSGVTSAVEEVSPSGSGTSAAQQPLGDDDSDKGAESLPGQQPRLFPLLVGGYFVTSEQSAPEQPFEPASSSADAPASEEGTTSAKSGAGAAKRPLDDDGSDDEEAPGPSWKVAKTGVPRYKAKAAAPMLVASRDSFLSSDGGPGSKPSTSAAASGLPRGCPPEEHAYVRLPTLKPGVRPRDFMPELMKLPYHPCLRHSVAVGHVRQLLRKQELSDSDVSLLVYYSEELANNAYFFMEDLPDTRKPIVAVTQLGRRFLTLHALFCASQTLKQDWPSKPWWRHLMGKIPHVYDSAPSAHGVRGGQNAQLAADLSEAVGKLKEGLPLPPAVVVDLMRRLFCLPNSPYIFRDKAWDPWRQDDEKEDPEGSGRC